MDYLRQGRCAVLVNLAATPIVDYLKCWQLGGVPCNNPDCEGEGGRWNTVPVRWASSTNQHEIFIDEDGAPNPLDYVKMRCITCHPGSATTYSPLDPIVLKRLPDSVRNALPWDWRWPFGEIKLHSVWTDGLDYDATKRQGTSNLLEKVIARSSPGGVRGRRGLGRPRLRAAGGARVRPALVPHVPAAAEQGAAVPRPRVAPPLRPAAHGRPDARRGAARRARGAQAAQ
eukprot:4074982-Prymnesium_polylepis.1